MGRLAVFLVFHAMLRAELPRFEQFPVSPLNLPPEVPLRFEKPEQEVFRPVFESARRTLALFAGHYDIAVVACGEKCRKMAIADRTTGKIHGSPFGTPEDEFAYPSPNWNPSPPQHSPASRLLVVPNVCPKPPVCATYYYLWEENRFRLLAEKPVSATPRIPGQSPFVGTWNGTWGYPNGTGSAVTAKFRLDFKQDPKSGRLSGTILNFDDAGKPVRGRIKSVVAKNPEKSAYRMEVDGECWNLLVNDHGEVEGIRNGGPCGPLGIGPGARLVPISATRAAGGPTPPLP